MILEKSNRMKKTKELKEMSGSELQEQLDDAKRELLSLRLNKVTGKVENPLQIRAVRRSIARMKTIMNQALTAEG